MQVPAAIKVPRITACSGGYVIATEGLSESTVSPKPTSHESTPQTKSAITPPHINFTINDFNSNKTFFIYFSNFFDTDQLSLYHKFVKKQILDTSPSLLSENCVKIFNFVCYDYCIVLLNIVE